MNKASKKIQTIYLTLLSFNTLAASFIWGVNTLFLLDAGLSNVEAFAANAFFTAGMVLFEIPTGVVADLRGRRLSYLLGVSVLIFSTLSYIFLWQMSAPFCAWALASIFLGFGFTFFSGAVEAWLVDALNYRGFKGNLETVFAKGQVVQGAAMLVGSVTGGMIAQISNLSIPYIIRVGFLVVTFILALIFMRDLGFKPHHGKRPSQEIRSLLRHSVDAGLRNPSVKWIMLVAPFSTGVMVYAFYAMQPYLLQLYGNEKAYGIAGLAAAIVAGAQIIGGLVAPWVSKHFRSRTGLLLVGTFTSIADWTTYLFLAGNWVICSVGAHFRSHYAGAPGLP